MTKKMINIHLTLLLSFLLWPGCSGTSTEPEDLLKSSISATGDITESYEGIAYFGISTFTSDMQEKEYFSIMVIPMEAENPLAMTLLYKSGPEPAEVGTYPVGKYAFGYDIPHGRFGGSFSAQNAEDFSGYTMTSGTLSISRSGSALISGTVEMSGYFTKFLEEDSTRIITVSGKFNAIPMPEVNP